MIRFCLRFHFPFILVFFTNIPLNFSMISPIFARIRPKCELILNSFHSISSCIQRLVTQKPSQTCFIIFKHHVGSLTGIESVMRFSKYDFTVFLDELASFDRQCDKELLLKRWTTVVPLIRAQNNLGIALLSSRFLGTPNQFRGRGGGNLILISLTLIGILPGFIYRHFAKNILA